MKIKVYFIIVGFLINLLSALFNSVKSIGKEYGNVDEFVKQDSKSKFIPKWYDNKKLYKNIILGLDFILISYFVVDIKNENIKYNIVLILALLIKSYLVSQLLEEDYNTIKGNISNIIIFGILSILFCFTYIFTDYIVIFLKSL